MKTGLLIPAVRPYFETFITGLDRRNLRYSILETLRTQAVQDAYYAQGRKPPEEVNALRKAAGLYPIGQAEAGKKITNAQYSLHQDGIAADIVPVLDNGKIPWNYGAYKELWLAFGRLGMEAGLEWGGHTEWKPLLDCGLGWDPPHYQRRNHA